MLRATEFMQASPPSELAFIFLQPIWEKPLMHRTEGMDNSGGMRALTVNEVAMVGGGKLSETLMGIAVHVSGIVSPTFDLFYRAANAFLGGGLSY